MCIHGRDCSLQCRFLFDNIFFVPEISGIKFRSSPKYVPNLDVFRPHIFLRRGPKLLIQCYKCRLLSNICQNLVMMDFGHRRFGAKKGQKEKKTEAAFQNSRHLSIADTCGCNNNNSISKLFSLSSVFCFGWQVYDAHGIKFFIITC